MRVTCAACGEELAFSELDLSKTELLIAPCEVCATRNYDKGWSDGSIYGCTPEED